ncbi:MAG TPA: hypothetical protein VEN79_15810 [Terriglobia bacterium]|nr:hypothetical protein [Terriglobia bacterium]
MKTSFVIKWLAGTAVALAAIAFAGMMNTPSYVQAQGQGNNDEDQLIHIGYAIAPVPLNLEGKNHEQLRLVGLGSFIVNAQGDCNGCHTGGAPPNFNYANNANPYFLNQPLGTKTDPTTYLAGGTPFGPAVPSSASVGGFPPGSIPSSYPPTGYPIDPTTGFPYVGPGIVSRNLTPDKNGRPEGGRTLEQFKQILRNGPDFDNIHPTCFSDTDPNIALGICIPPPVDGSKLQVMPWPAFHNMTDHQIEAIYEYLSVIPCIDNNFAPPPAGAPNELRNDCGSSDASLIPRAPSLFHGGARASARK